MNTQKEHCEKCFKVQTRFSKDLKSEWPEVICTNVDCKCHTPQNNWEEELDAAFGIIANEKIEGVPFKADYGDFFGVRDELKDFIRQTLASQRETLAVSVEGLKPKQKPYDGNDLQSACDYYGIAAESWAEIIRYENGYSSALTDAAAHIRKQ